jgi:hypothetical protein
MTLPPSDFAAAFRQHVVPPLRAMVERDAMRFWTEDMDFSDIADDAWHFALRRGAEYLPDVHRDALRDWLYAFVSDQIEAARSVHEEAEALVRGLLREPSREVIRESVRGFLSAG